MIYFLSSVLSHKVGTLGIVLQTFVRFRMEDRKF